MIERLDRMYALVWREHDLDAAMTHLPDDFEWVVPGHPDGAVRRGRHAVNRDPDKGRRAAGRSP